MLFLIELVGGIVLITNNWFTGEHIVGGVLLGVVALQLLILTVGAIAVGAAASKR